MSDYFTLTKPGIVRGNTITAIAAFLFASVSPIAWAPCFAMAIGTAAVIASACVFNNYFDRHLDAKMARTQKRALVTGTISTQHALVFGVLLLICGVLVLFFHTTTYATAAAVLAWASYVFVYTPLKPYTHHATIIGTIPGALPPLVGYFSVTPQIDALSLLLFLALITWQMPHFIAIALFRNQEYEAAGIPTLVHELGVPTSLFLSLLYQTLFGATVFVLGLISPMHWFYYGAIALTCVWWGIGIYALRAPNKDVVAVQSFRVSLLVLLAFSIGIALS
ncbi:protoheme IX farnesyltransferase [bacterium]|nr:protoheme IX farnesyltransferase [bacterium]